MRTRRLSLGIALLVMVGIVSLIIGVFGRGQDALVAAAAPPAPTAAVVARAMGSGLPNGGWLARTSAQLHIHLAAGGNEQTVVPEVELLPIGRHFTGTPNVIGQMVVLPARGRRDVAITVRGLIDTQRYHWQARLRAMDGTTSRWIGDSAFGVDNSPPPAPRITSVNVPAGQSTARSTPSLHWTQPRDLAGIAYYEYAVSAGAGTTLAWHRTVTRELHLHGLADGSWQIQVRAIDLAGNRSDALRWQVTVDRTPPSVAEVTARAATPSLQQPSLYFALSEPANVSLTLIARGTSRVVARAELGRLAAGAQDNSWSARDAAGRQLPSGSYTLRLEARDAAGNVGLRETTVQITAAKRIVVSLTRQDLTAYDGDTAVLHTLITSGGPETSTPTGTFTILARYSPYVMISPWPRSSPLWYADSPVNYALLFRDGGYFLHDAPWRSNWGPGSNSVQGAPGGNTTGTHGCVNVPLAAERWLYTWAPNGTIVQIEP